MKKCDPVHPSGLAPAVKLVFLMINFLLLFLLLMKDSFKRESIIQVKGGTVFIHVQ